MQFRRFLTIFFFLLSASAASEIRAQTFGLSVDDVTLAEAVVEFERVTGTQVAFSDFLVGSISVSCSMQTDDMDALLRCVLGGTGILFQFTPPGQYVLIPPRTPRSPAAKSHIFGFITDAENRASLFGAHVSVPGSGRGTVTNEAGFFRLPDLAPGSTQVYVSFLGYSRLDTVLVAPAEFIQLQLEPVTLPYATVLVEGEDYTFRERVTPPGALSVSMRQLEELPGALGGKDVLSSLGLMSGIQRTGEATGGLVIRGSGPDQNLYLVDGAPVYHPWHAFSLVSTFQTEIFKDVQFYRGAFPAEFGGRISSVMNAELRDGASPEPRAVASINAMNARFFIESPIGSSSSFMLSGRRSYIDKLIGKNHAVTDVSGRQDTLRTGYFFHDWSAKLSIKPTRKSDLSFTYYTGRDVLDLKLPFDLSLDFSSWLRPADLFFEVDQKWGNDLFSTRFRLLASDRLFVTSSVYYSRYKAREASFVQPTEASSVVSAYQVELADIGLKVHADYQANQQHQIRFGVLVVNHSFDSSIDALVTYGPNLTEELSEGGEINAVEVAGFIQDEWSVTRDLTIQAGLRTSVFGRDSQAHLSPRLSFQWNVEPSLLTIRGAVSQHVQYLQRLRDRYSFLYDLVSARWIPSDSTVRPATSTHFSVGAEMNPRPWLRISVDAFHRNSDDVILPRDAFQSKDGLLGPGIETGTLLGQHTSGEEQSTGFEASALLHWTRWNIHIAYTGYVSKNRTPLLEDNEFHRSRYDVPRAVTVVGQHSVGQWDFSSTLNWRAGYPITVPVSRYALEDPLTGRVTNYFHRPDVNNGRLPPYFRLDVSIRYRFTFLRAAWSAEFLIYNVLGRRNVINRTFDPALEGFQWSDQRGFPRVPLFELEMRL